ncbi:alpha/beta hydrolase [Nonomuraea roseoviolacea]|uniref:Pimeloyl-ACP methyl ester carboxylesterase n=1 Tax=Nonomuraea roseoviolacea subsp. carminata TaxID=160689 RepID=A0ABT1JUK4_9ACTN|nr:alpha/beta hydrolase [Nonomuraea roseoviolacea]MCP2344509.1 pimeloyl-ACP methyl ester carboxylesterase [Nonomuraea roseoviolacea subsp. carminata]
MRVDEVGGLRIAVFGDGPRVIIAVHGISASLMAWAAVGRRLPEGWSMVAMDLRGRGHSAGLPGPYGLPRHAEDVLRVADHVGADDGAVLTGHSMGAYVAALAAARRSFARVVLVDGGLPLPLPPGTDPDTALAATLGPALARLSRTFATPDDYVAFFRAHPAFARSWNDDVEAYVRYDLTGPPGALRSRAVEDAVREDGRWLLTGAEELGAALASIEAPLRVLRAPRGLLDQEVGMLPDELAAAWTARLPHLEDEVVPDCNHYTILFEERCASLVAARLTG